MWFGGGENDIPAFSKLLPKKSSNVDEAPSLQFLVQNFTKVLLNEPKVRYEKRKEKKKIVTSEIEWKILNLP